MRPFIIVIIFAFFSANLKFSFENCKLKEALFANNHLLGNLLDKRDTQKVATDIRRKDEEVHYEVHKWINKEKSKHDLFGHDDPTILQKLKKIKNKFFLFIEELQKKIKLKKQDKFKWRFKKLVSYLGKYKKKIKENDIRSLNEIKDLGGTRIITQTVDEVYNYRDLIRFNFEVLSEKDFIKKQESFGYQSYHMIVSYKGWPFEIQIRTCKMDQFANWSHKNLYKPKKDSQNSELSPKERWDEYRRSLSSENCVNKSDR